MAARLISVSVAVLLALCAAYPAFAGNGAIGVYSDPDCGNCSVAVSVGVPFTLYVNATLGGGTADGIVSAAFAIDGMPPNWLIVVTANPLASTVLGNPFQGGALIGFTSCLTSVQGCDNLYTVWVLPTATPIDVRLQVTRFRTCPAPHELYLAPLLYTCDAPAFTGYWVGGGAAILNGPPCTVATMPRTWSYVKHLYGG